MAIASSAIIQDIEGASTTGPAHMAYFFFDLRDTGKQPPRAFLSSILVQLGHQTLCLSDILLEFYSAPQHGSDQPSVGALKECLMKMLEALGEAPIYVIVDALDECPHTLGVQSSRRETLELIKELTGLNLSNLRLCVTSRPEVDIWNVLGPITSTSNRICLHLEDGQKRDLIDYVSSIVYSDKDVKKWQEDDKSLVIQVLSDRADGV